MSREKSQSDIDLERFIGLMDEAFMSTDERVVNALRSLMMMVILTKPESDDSSLEGRRGPLGEMRTNLKYAIQRIDKLENDMIRLHSEMQRAFDSLSGRTPGYIHDQNPYPRWDPYSMDINNSAMLTKAFGKFK